MEHDLIRKVLLDNGMMPNVKGFWYSVEVLELMAKKAYNVADLYKIVASRHGVKSNTVEKGISNAIDKAFGKSRILARYEKECLRKGKISNKKFFAILLKQINRSKQESGII